LLDYEDEVVALVTFLLDRHALRSLEATFAESLYGLKREAWRDSGSGSSSGSGSGAARSQQQQQQQQQGAATRRAPGAPLGRTGENWALLCSVVLPYLQAKAERLHTRHAQQQHGVLGLALRRAATPAGRPGGPGSSGGSTAWAAQLQRMRAGALAVFVRVYPYLHAGIEAARFSYQLAYLLDASDYHSPAMKLLGQRLVRMSAPEMVSFVCGAGWLLLFACVLLSSSACLFYSP